MKKAVIATVAVGALVGCSSTPPTRIGADTYFASRTNTGGAFGNPAAVAGKLMAEGNVFCADLGREFELVTQTISPPRPAASLGGASITFRCVDHAGPVTLRPDNGVSTIESR
jgi:hypothetical protein